jgi:F5/8 type C domain
VNHEVKKHINCDVMCFAQGMQTSYVNVALKKLTWQSSNYTSLTNVDWGSERAVDGNKNTNIFENSCSHTNMTNTVSWWAVDLGSLSRVFGVNLTNREDCCGELLFSFFQVINLINHEAADHNEQLLQCNCKLECFSCRDATALRRG